MAARASVCFALGLLLTGCPFALFDDYVIVEDAAVAAVPVVAPIAEQDAGSPDDATPESVLDACPKKGPGECRGDECQGLECPKKP